jgi:hypothetical protein
MREIHGIVTRQIIWQRKALQPKRRDLIVSAIGGLGHSGAEYARRYADENQIYPDNVVTINQIPEAIQFVDDFFGTGVTLASELSNIPMTVSQALNGKGLSSFVLVIAGYSDGVRTVQRAIEELDFSLDLHVCDLFRSEEALLGEHSKIFHSWKIESALRIWFTNMESSLSQMRLLGMGIHRRVLCLKTRSPTIALPFCGSRREIGSHSFAGLSG